MAKKRKETRLGRDPFNFVIKTSQEQATPKTKGKRLTTSPTRQVGEKETKGVNKAREVHVEYDSSGTIIATLELILAEDLDATEMRLEPQGKNIVGKFSSEEDLLKLQAEYKVDVLKKPHKLIKK